MSRRPQRLATLRRVWRRRHQRAIHVHILSILALATLVSTIAAVAWSVVVSRRVNAQAAIAPQAEVTYPASDPLTARRDADLAAMKTFRPGYPFWQHVFALPDHSIAFGSSVDGRLLAIVRTKGDGTRGVVWADPTLARLLDGQRLARKPGERREQVALLLERASGPVMHNATRGDALRINAPKFGRFLAEWGAIYERFGVPADIGLAQVILESGLDGKRRSEANAVGFCQWLRRNWQRLNYFSPTVIEGSNQTTQAPYCAAYLSVLATKYGSFIPALSEHNAGGTNVGRVLINGEHLGADDVRAQYLMGSKLARDLRALPGRQYEDVYRSYGPRSYLYAEMVFGNTFNVRNVMDSMVQVPIYAMRTSRAISLAEIVKRTQLPVGEVRRFNPALAERVPAQSTLYLPFYVSEFGSDVAFWRHPASPAYAAVLADFMRLDAGPEQWDDPAFAPVLKEFQRRFAETRTEEGMVMQTVLTYAMDQAYRSTRRALLSEFRNSDQVRDLVIRGVRELDAERDRQQAVIWLE
jgi:hypothetical protein